MKSLLLLFICFAKADKDRNEFFRCLQIRNPITLVALKNAQLLLRAMLIKQHKESLSENTKLEIRSYFGNDFNEEMHFKKVIKKCLEIEPCYTLPLTQGQIIKGGL